MQIRPFQLSDLDDVIALWQSADLTRLWNDPRKDIERKLAVQPELFVVAVDDEQIVGSVMAGYDGHRGWMNYLATSESARRTGVGRALVEHAERELLALGCPKINIQVRSSNSMVVEFYEKLGYVIDDTIDLGKRLIAD